MTRREWLNAVHTYGRRTRCTVADTWRTPDGEWRATVWTSNGHTVTVGARAMDTVGTVRIPHGSRLGVMQ